MFRVLFVADIHSSFDGRIPYTVGGQDGKLVRVLNDYKQRISEVVEVGRQYNVDCACVMGDLGDSQDDNKPSALDAMFLDLNTNLFDITGAEVFPLLGNHDNVTGNGNMTVNEFWEEYGGLNGPWGYNSAAEWTGGGFDTVWHESSKTEKFVAYQNAIYSAKNFYIIAIYGNENAGDFWDTDGAQIDVNDATNDVDVVGGGSTEQTWLAAAIDTAQASNYHVLVLSHEPITEDGSGYDAGEVALIQGELEAYSGSGQVTLVSGHYHQITPNTDGEARWRKDTTNGVIYYRLGSSAANEQYVNEGEHNLFYIFDFDETSGLVIDIKVFRYYTETKRRRRAYPYDLNNILRRRR